MLHTMLQQGGGMGKTTEGADQVDMRIDIDLGALCTKTVQEIGKPWASMAQAGDHIVNWISTRDAPSPFTFAQLEALVGGGFDARKMAEDKVSREVLCKFYGEVYRSVEISPTPSWRSPCRSP